MTISKFIYHTDEFKVKNYSNLFIAVVAALVLYCSIACLSFPLLWLEHDVLGANIKSYGDAFWTLQMSASTIGFGDFYPVSMGGRAIVAVMFYVGVGIVGFIGAQIANRVLGFSNTNVRNRELRQQNEEILMHNKLLEHKLDLMLETLEGRV